jgi:L-alanine-DL-glutamate epimerase-like enolase superfamily enzyme
LFGDTPEETFEKAKRSRESGFRAVKFGWGPFGRNSLESDLTQLYAAREGLGDDAYLMIDAGALWKDDVEAATYRMKGLKQINAYWLEEPFTNLALDSYKKLAESSPDIPLAAGEGCNNLVQAQSMIKYAGLKFLQIDSGRIGGITVAKRVADLTREAGVVYVNHTFTSNLSLSASLQSYAGMESNLICEYPVELKSLAQDITKSKMDPDGNGFVHVPEMPGLGITVDVQALKKYLVDVEISVKGKPIYRTPEL